MKRSDIGQHPPSTLASEPWVDWGKAVASQLIVWHHLVHYGPLAPRLAAWWPAGLAWLNQRALYAVQAFLVMGGYLAARSLWPQPGRPRVGLADWAPRMGRRWQRLWLPYLVALVLAVLGAALARQLMLDEDTPAAPTAWQLLTHLLLLQDVAGQPALSAGVWYVAIDLQLYALLAGLAALARWAIGRWPTRPPGHAAIGAAWLMLPALAAILWINRLDGADVLAPYFFGSYALGVLAAWGREADAPAARTHWGLAIALLTCAGLWLAWRDRLAVAALCAGLLLWAPRGLAMAGGLLRAGVARLAAISYAVFLLHYPVSLVVNALALRLLPDGPGAAAAGLLAAWLLSLAAGWALTAWFERGVPRWPSWLPAALPWRRSDAVR